MELIEKVARKLCTFYKKARTAENPNYCNYTDLESYINSSWMHFKEEAKSLIEIIKENE